ncbi:hypothetical protein FISHEDRAFT_56734 [Fistulina hepatica ATCC 64428]|uniref:F-box domain-containing protein n=1 Tax=Fistulina hepatica ATCC 64428 TaxID=1128425 RepID=A0A0D7AH73_9AGAR|nr:hypothetical protein FISHEDRAFT_56734 [Fistulina hepatica ATCC 64428]
METYSVWMEDQPYARRRQFKPAPPQPPVQDLEYLPRVHINDLPTEVLLIILLLGYPPRTVYCRQRYAYDEKDVMHRYTGPQGPPPLYRVCRRWKAILTSYPEFRAGIGFLPFVHPIEYKGCDIERLLRAHGGRLFWLHYHIDEGHAKLSTTEKAAAERCSEGLAKLVRCSWRWWEADIEVPVSFIPRLSKGDFPLLRAIKLNLIGGGKDLKAVGLNGKYQTPFYRTAPKLRRVHIVGDATKLFVFKWMFLTELTLEKMTVSTQGFVPVFKGCTSLLVLSFIKCEFRDTRRRISAMPSVKEVRCTDCQTASVLSDVHFPNLSTLEVSISRTETKTDAGQVVHIYPEKLAYRFRAIVFNGARSIKRVVLNFPPEVQDTIIECLKSLHNLEELELNFDHAYYDFDRFRQFMKQLSIYKPRQMVSEAPSAPAPAPDDARDSTNLESATKDSTNTESAAKDSTNVESTTKDSASDESAAKNPAVKESSFAVPATDESDLKEDQMSITSQTTEVPPFYAHDLWPPSEPWPSVVPNLWHLTIRIPYLYDELAATRLVQSRLPRLKVFDLYLTRTLAPAHQEARLSQTARYSFDHMNAHGLSFSLIVFIQYMQCINLSTLVTGGFWYAAVHIKLKQRRSTESIHASTGIAVQASLCNMEWVPFGYEIGTTWPRRVTYLIFKRYEPETPLPLVLFLGTVDEEGIEPTPPPMNKLMSDEACRRKSILSAFPAGALPYDTHKQADMPYLEAVILLFPMVPSVVYTENRRAHDWQPQHLRQSSSLIVGWSQSSGRQSSKSIVTAGEKSGRLFVHDARAFFSFSFGPAICVWWSVVCAIMQRFDMRIPPGSELEDYAIAGRGILPMILTPHSSQ